MSAAAAAALTCEFCKSRVSVQELERWTVCQNCKQVSKKCKKGSGVYYRIADPRTGVGAAGVYVTGDQLPDVAKSVGRDAIVFDFHNVADRFAPDEFAKLVAPFVKTHTLHVLSYVGSTTPTRVEADADIQARMALVPELHGWLCFRRSEVVEAGNKGGFIRALGASSVCFFDDSEDHVASGKAAGADSVLVSSKDRREARRTIGRKLRELMGLPDVGGAAGGVATAGGGSGGGGGNWSGGGGRGRGRGRVQGGWVK